MGTLRGSSSHIQHFYINIHEASLIRMRYFCTHAYIFSIFIKCSMYITHIIIHRTCSIKCPRPVMGCAIVLLDSCLKSALIRTHTHVLLGLDAGSEPPRLCGPASGCRRTEGPCRAARARLQPVFVLPVRPADLPAALAARQIPPPSPDGSRPDVPPALNQALRDPGRLLWLIDGSR